ncbi:MAG TPA: DUF3619 family protein [Rubrivivax sp.]|nr:DUF3619 family protein [Rubrivivax sp.]
MTTSSRSLQEQAIEGRLALRLAAALAERTQAVPHDIAERLRVARKHALARARAVRAAQVAARPARQSAAAAIVLSGGRGTATLGAPTPWSPRLVWWQRAASVLPLVMLIAGLVMINRVAEVEQVHAAAEVDSQLLADALPPSAYTDPGFAEYLRSTP